MDEWEYSHSRNWFPDDEKNHDFFSRILGNCEPFINLLGIPNITCGHRISLQMSISPLRIAMPCVVYLPSYLSVVLHYNSRCSLLTVSIP